MVFEGANTHHLAHGGPLLHLWSAATRPTPFTLGVVVISILFLSTPRSGVHRLVFHDLHMVLEGEDKHQLAHGGLI